MIPFECNASSAEFKLKVPPVMMTEESPLIALADIVVVLLAPPAVVAVICPPVTVTSVFAEMASPPVVMLMVPASIVM
jgi:hypothetical protein